MDICTLPIDSTTQYTSTWHTGDHPIVIQCPFLHAAMWGGVHLEIKCQCQSILPAKCFNESNALRPVYVYNG